MNNIQMEYRKNYRKSYIPTDTNLTDAFIFGYGHFVHNLQSKPTDKTVLDDDDDDDDSTIKLP